MAVIIPAELSKTPALARRLANQVRLDAKIKGWSADKSTQIVKAILEDLVVKSAVLDGSVVTGWRDEYFTRVCPDDGE
jgi:uncharacterized membrane protein affecting hemolysin expression